MRQRRRFACALAVLLVLASFLFFFRLGRESLTTDEYFSFYVATQPLERTLSGDSRQLNPNTLPPLYEVLLHFWMRVFGESEYAQRSLSALLGVASVALIFLLTALLFDRATGIIAALLGALSSSWFLFFRMNRCYGLLLFLTLLSAYLYFYYRRHRDSEAAFLGLIAANSALLYTHYFAILVIGSETLFSAFEWRRDRRWTLRILLMSVLTIVVFTPWNDNALLDIAREPIIAESARYQSLWHLVFRMLVTLLYHFHIRWEPLLVLIYLPFLSWGLLRAVAGAPGDAKRERISLILFCALPSAAIFLLTQIDRLRYYAPFSFPLLIFLAFGLRQLAATRRRRLLAVPLIAVLMVLNAADFRDLLTEKQHEDWRGAAETIKAVPGYNDKEMVFVFQTKYNPPVFAYYLWGKEAAAALVDNIATGDSYDKDIRGFSSGNHHLYVVAPDERLDGFLRLLEMLPGRAWVWVLRYRDHFFANEFRIRNGGRYFFHQIPLNEELPQIDFYLIRSLS